MEVGGRRYCCRDPSKEVSSEMAQVEIFEQLFYDLNNWISKENKRLSHTEYANIPRNIRQQIDMFAMYSTSSNFVLTDGFWSYTGSDMYRPIGLSVVHPTGKKVDVDIVGKSAWNNFNNNLDTKPTLTFPIGYFMGDKYKISPTLPTGYSAELFYIRQPKKPRWTYIEVDGNPIYNPSASDKQDFELEYSLMPKLVVGILKYLGVSIREADIVQLASAEEAKTIQTQS